MSETKVNFIRQFWISITNWKEYPLLKAQTLGKAFGYLFLITLVFGSIGLIKPIIEFNDFLEELAVQYQTKVPEFAFGEGALRVDAKMPVVLLDEDNSLFVIDTSGATAKNILDKYEEGALVTKDKLFFKHNRYEQREYNFSEFKEVRFTKSDLGSWIPYLKWLSFLIVLFGWGGFMVGKLFSALLVSLVGLIIFNSYREQLNFGQIYKLAIYALTLPILIKIALDLVGYTLPLFFLLYYGLAIVYLVLAASYFKPKLVTEIITENQPS